MDRIDFSSSSDKNNIRYRMPVSFVTDHGTPPATIYPYTRDTVDLPRISAPGYDFKYWESIDANYTNHTLLVGSEAITLTAKWAAWKNMVAFYSSKGYTPSPLRVTSGQTVHVPSEQLVGSEYIAGWYNNSDFTGEPYDFSEPVLNDLDLYAKWEQAPQVSVNITGAGQGDYVIFCDKRYDSKVFATVTSSGSVYVPADAKMIVTAADGIDYNGLISAEIADGDTGIHYLKSTDIVNGTPEYTTNYGIGAHVNICFSSTPTVSVNIESDDGLDTNSLWTLKDGYNNVYTGGSAVNVPTGLTVPEAMNLTLTLNVPSGYGCDGTIINGDSTIAISDGCLSYTFTPAGNVTVNLHYYSRNKYVTMTFRDNTLFNRFFTLKYPKIDANINTFTVPECPYTQSHSVFCYWYASGDTNTMLNPGDEVTLPNADTTYLIRFDDAHFVSFNRNSGTGSMPKLPALSANSYTAALPECTFTRSGYAFAKWNTKANGSGTDYYPGNNITLTGNVTLYAQWERTYAVSLYDNFGDGCTTLEIPRVGSGTIPQEPLTRDGYWFMGSNTASDGNGTHYEPGDTITPTANLSLYAQWKQYYTEQLTPISGTKVKVDREKAVLCGMSPATDTSDLKPQFLNDPDRIIITADSSIASTGCIVLLVDDEDSEIVLDELTVVLYGDVNVDGYYDGQDAIIVSCIASGLLTSVQIGEAKYLAADCNHDGLVDNTDVTLLEQAGVLLSQIMQTDAEEESAAEDAVNDYLMLIDQCPNVNQTPIEAEKPDDQPTEPTPAHSSVMDLIRQLIPIFQKVLNNLFSMF